MSNCNVTHMPTCFEADGYLNSFHINWFVSDAVALKRNIFSDRILFQYKFRIEMNLDAYS